MEYNALLINPWIYDFAAYNFWNNPLGLLYVASILRTSKINVHYLDCLDPYHPDLMGSPVKQPKRKSPGLGSYARIAIKKPEPLQPVQRAYHRYGITPESLLRKLCTIQKPDVIMITSMMTYWYQAVWDIIHVLHKQFPDVPIVLGGNYVNLLPEHAPKSSATYCLPGPAEKTVPSLMRNLFNMDSPDFPEDDLDALPYPAFDLLRHCDQVSILTSRGCPYRCVYCSSHLFHAKHRKRDPIRVADEIEHWNRHLGVTHFSFYDDALLVEPEMMIVPLLEEILRRNIRVHFHCPNGLHLKEITPRIGALLFQSGFQTLRFGFETSNIQRQWMTGGKVFNEDLSDALSLLESSGYERKDIGIYLLCGLPFQSPAEVRESILYVQSLGAKPILAEYSPIPGTALWEESLLASPYPLQTEPLFHNNSLLPCRHDDLSLEEYQRLKQLTRTGDSAFSSTGKMAAD